MDCAQKERSLIVSLDVGRRFVGVAKGRKGSKIAFPEGVLKGNKAGLLVSLVNYLKREKADKVVVGLPLSEDMALTEEARYIVRFIKQLKKRVKCEVVYVDEYGSTLEALEEKEGRGIRGKRADHIAAKKLLEQFLNKRAVVVSSEQVKLKGKGNE